MLDALCGATGDRYLSESVPHSFEEAITAKKPRPAGKGGSTSGPEEDGPRPHAREVFLRLKEASHEVYLWSSAGGAYAAAAAEVFGVADLTDGCFGTRQEPDVGVDFVVDDDVSVVGSYGGYLIEAFGGDPHDEELLRIPEAVDASGD